MAATPKRRKKRAPPRKKGSQLEKFQATPLGPGNRELSDLEMAIVQLYGQGLPNAEVARHIADHIHPEWRHNRERQLRLTRAKLRRMEKTQWFRDALYDQVVAKTDLAIPAIMEGVVKKAKRGRVDAAKLAMSVAGRAVETSDGAVNVPISINFQGSVPRPYGIDGRSQAEDDEEIEDAEWDEEE